MITYQPEAYYEHKPTGQRLSESRYRQVRVNNPSDWTRIEGVRPEVEQAFADLVKALNDSPMNERSRLIDAGKSGGYWSRIIERAARAFENYVIAKMTQQGYHNDYLANVATISEFQRAAGRYPYLLENEVAPVAEAFDNLFGTIQTRETDTGVELYQPETGKPVSDFERREQLRTMKPVNVDSSEFGNQTDTTVIRKKAEQVWDDQLQGKSVEHAQFSTPIRFVRTGFKETKHHSADTRVLKLLPSLPQLVRSGIRLWSEASTEQNKPNIIGYHFLGTKAELDGQSVYVLLRIREDNDGHLYYDNDVTSTEVIEKGALAQPGLNPSQVEEQSRLSRNKLYQWWHSVKPSTTSNDGELNQPDDATPGAYRIEERDGRLQIVDAAGAAYKPGMSIYSGENTPETRARLENNLRVLNELAGL
jgi:hypothetical protein